MTAAPTRHRPAGINVELLAWVFMRASGLLLVVLVLGRVLDARSPAGLGGLFPGSAPSAPLRAAWDLSLLWLAQLHGANGLRTAVDNSARAAATRARLKALVYAASVLVLALGTYVVFTPAPG